MDEKINQNKGERGQAYLNSNNHRSQQDGEGRELESAGNGGKKIIPSIVSI
jgi:hypothetical protein